MTPPPIQSESSGKSFAITSLVIAAIGIIPTIIYLFQCLACLADLYQANILLVLFMAFVGFFIHLGGVLFGFLGHRKGSGMMGMLGIILNGVILGIIVIGGFFALVGQF